MHNAALVLPPGQVGGVCMYVHDGEKIDLLEGNPGGTPLGTQLA